VIVKFAARRNDKAAGVTTLLALRGKLVELRSDGRGMIGGETLSPKECARLLAAIEKESEEHSSRGSIGIKVLESAPVETLVAAATALFSRWSSICRRASELQPPMRLHPPTTFAAALSSALWVPPVRVFTDDPATIPELREAFPGVMAQHWSDPEASIEPSHLTERWRERSPDGGGCELERHGLRL
jgi:hypothetical protein